MYLPSFSLNGTWTSLTGGDGRFFAELRTMGFAWRPIFREHDSVVGIGVWYCQQHYAAVRFINYTVHQSWQSFNINFFSSGRLGLQFYCIPYWTAIEGQCERRTCTWIRVQFHALFGGQCCKVTVSDMKRSCLVSVWIYVWLWNDSCSLFIHGKLWHGSKEVQEKDCDRIFR